MLNRNATYLASIGETVNDVNELMTFAFEQANNLSPFGRAQGVVDAVVAAPGLDLTFTRNYDQLISSRYTLGPLGRGWAWGASGSRLRVRGLGDLRLRRKPDQRARHPLRPAERTAGGDLDQPAAHLGPGVLERLGRHLITASPAGAESSPGAEVHRPRPTRARQTAVPRQPAHGTRRSPGLRSRPGRARWHRAGPSRCARR